MSWQDVKGYTLAVWKIAGIRDAAGRFTPTIKERLTCVPFSGGTTQFTIMLLQDTRGGR